MQAITRVLQHFLHAAAKKKLQIVGKLLAHRAGAGAFFTGLELVVLGDVIARQHVKRIFRLCQAGRGHAPGTNGSPHQVDGVLALGQPVTKQKTVQGPQNQTFGATGCCGHDGDVGRA